ncbi:oligosaccharide flippase family protein [Colwellia sp. 1_MG-2023]|uniref:oligosaccharide flippase family protein n=1 Tax=Colwellia sp. 1_MG-2023 TaxID=3062649 RepID=UPI0026E32BF7|nr:oligosaccharide flippase family protein [Colwellia sp. 1_MG-2023]MDO6444980.1 oligosaccharide flippase family protein [Colwellia sp. 1_MG-2023]
MKNKKERKTSSALLKGSSFRVIQTVISIGIGFWMLPFLISHLGSEDYALWVLIGSIISSYYLMDLGLNHTVTRYVARYIYTEEYDRANQIINTALLIYSVLGVVLFTLTVLAVFFIAPEIVNDPEDLRTAQAILLISGLSLSLEFPSKAFPGVISAYLRFDTIALVRTLGSVLSALAIFLFISNGSGVVTLAIISFVSNITITIFFIYYSYNLFSSLDIAKKHVSKKDMIEIFHFSKWTFIVDVTNLLKNKMDIWMIASFLSSVGITTYFIAARLIEYATQIVGQALGFTVPVFTKYYAQDQLDKMAEALVFFVKLYVLLLVLFVAGFIVLGEQFIRLWIGDEINIEVAYQCLIILAVGRLLVLITNPFVSVLMTIKKHKYVTYLSLVDTIAVTLSAIYLIPNYGLIGAAIAFSLVVGVLRVTYLPFIVSQLTGIKLIPLIFNSLFFIVYSSGVTYLFMSFIGGIDDWLKLILYAFIVGFSILPGTILLFSKNEKYEIKQWVISKFKKQVGAIDESN